MVLDSRQVITLARRGLVPMQLAAGARIECTRGRIWITEHALPLDVVLEPGESYNISRRGEVVVQALREADFSVRNSGVRRPAARLPARLAKLLNAARTTSAASPSAA
jgi:hypothetical protein